MSQPTIPKTCRAAVCVERGPNFKVELREDYPVPEPGPDDILIKLNVTGLCQSDVHHMIGDLGLGAQADCVGHEGAGVVVAVGANVEDWKIGDRAGVKPCVDTCGRCEFCLEGYDLNCPKVGHILLEVIWVHVESKRVMSAYFRNGTYCQYLVHPARYASRLPDGLSDELAAPILCAGATTYRAVQQSGAKAGQWLVVPGAGGGVGSFAVQYAAAQGIRVIGIDTSKDKEKMCLEQLGCEAFVDFRECKDIPSEVKRITNGGAHALIVTGGTKSAYDRWHEMLRVGGVLVAVGLPSKGELVLGADPTVFVTRSLSIKGTMVASFRETDMALSIASTGRVKPQVTTYAFKEWLPILEKLHKGQIVGRACVRFED